MKRTLAWGGAVALVGLLALFGLRSWLASEPELRERVLQRTGGRLTRVLTFPTAGEGELVVISLRPVLRGFTRPTDMVFSPADSAILVVLEQAGRLSWAELGSGKVHEWFRVAVEDASNEQGLLGIALHPRFRENGRFFLNSTRTEQGRTFSLIDEYRVPDPRAPFAAAPALVREIMRVEQPYPNHNGGCLRFGPDAMLYVGWGDGGSGGDPLGHGQNTGTLLGAILRIDVDGAEAGRAYRIPPDNPFVGKPGAAGELFALGVRNPWRFSFAPDGRLVVADVGQNAWEEVGFAMRGDNLGWNRMEGRVCYGERRCDKTGLRLPFHVYDRTLGQSVTGGEVALAPGPLQDLYVFGDYVSGRLWALALPETESSQPVEASELGTWPVHPSSFARDAAGRLYLADHLGGSIQRIDPEPYLGAAR